MSSNRSDCRVEPGARVHDSARLGPFVHVGPEVEVGPDAVLAANVVVTGRTRIGARVRIGPGTVIGCTGFGYETKDGRHERLPHTGETIIEDDVELGASCTVARAKEGRVTRIGRGTKVDCQVHVAHNVVIGEDCLIAAQSGIAGSAELGNRVRLAGQVGVKDHVRLGDDAVVYAKSAVYRSIPAGARYSGIPARPHRETKRLWAWLRRERRRHS